MVIPLIPVSILVVSLLIAQDLNYPEREVLELDQEDWVPQTQPTSLASGPLDEARKLLAEKRPRKAAKLLETWLEQNPDSDQYYEGVFLLGDAYFEREDFWKALTRYTEVAENSSGELFTQANRRAMDVARAFLSGQPRIIWGFLRVPAYDDGLEALNRIWERAPGTRLGETALKLRADYFYDDGQMLLAQDEYANLAKEYPSGRYVQYASLRAAESAEAAFSGIRYSDKPLLEAAERYGQVKRAFPDYAIRENVDQRLEGIRRLRAEKDLEIAKWYEKTDRAGAAEFYYRQILKDWPDTLSASQAAQRLRAMGIELPPEGEVSQ